MVSETRAADWAFDRILEVLRSEDGLSCEWDGLSPVVQIRLRVSIQAVVATANESHAVQRGSDLPGAVAAERQACLTLCKEMVAAHKKYHDACMGASLGLAGGPEFNYMLGKHDAAFLLADAVKARV
jgi:hypothetical protein